MAGHAPNLDPQSLGRLRSLVESMHRENGSGVPMERLVELASDVHLGGGVTIDFDASQKLGQPMVVLRIPTEYVGDSELFVALSPREREVAALLAEGMPNKAIAEKLFISVATVKDHVHHILRKTGLPSRAAVAATCHGDRTTPLDHT